jgi:hypothetical protein
MHVFDFRRVDDDPVKTVAPWRAQRVVMSLKVHNGQTLPLL